MAEFLDLSLRNYQRLEGGEVFPQEATLALLTSKLGVDEPALVLDPDQIPAPPPLPKTVEELTEIVKRQDREIRELKERLSDYEDGPDFDDTPPLDPEHRPRKSKT